jgi:RimJ/RimL family protein N-acetyltransferase
MLKIVNLDGKYCDELAAILSTDSSLHKFLSPDQLMTEISGDDYYSGCADWETKKDGRVFCVLFEQTPIGSISYVHKDALTASVGMWVASEFWNKGLGAQILNIFTKMVKDYGYKYLTGVIQKWNPRSKSMCEKCGAIFKEDQIKWYPTLRL